MILEVGNPASWKTRKAGMIQSEVEDPWIRGSDVANPSLRTEGNDRRCPSSTVRQEKKRTKFHLPLPFVLFRLSVDWMVLNHTWEGSLLYWVYQFQCKSHPKTAPPPKTHTDTMFNLDTHGRVKLKHKTNHSQGVRTANFKNLIKKEGHHWARKMYTNSPSSIGLSRQVLRAKAAQSTRDS